jgi:hypothetical protein
MLGAVDRGWLGLQPLRAHAVILGFPRAGTTLLQAMVTACVDDVRTWRDERRALVEARSALRNHPYMMTKCPYDLFIIDEIRAFYARRAARVVFILLARDPRGVLTSRHFSKEGYYVEPAYWRATYEYWRYAVNARDVVSLRYEDLVRDPNGVQATLAREVGWGSRAEFSEFSAHLPPGFDARAMNGLRSVETETREKWRGESERIRELLARDLPELPEVLIEMGYEKDKAWLTPYL